jgi:hypothetical protein
MANRKTKPVAKVAPDAKRAVPFTHKPPGKREAKPQEEAPKKVTPFGGMPYPDFPTTGPVKLDVTKERIRKSTRRKPGIPQVPTVADKAPKEAPKEPKAVIVETLQVPAALLLAAETVAAKADKEAGALHGVLIHQKDEKRARVVASDGARLFVANFPVTKTPSWLKAGLMLDRGDLKKRVSMLATIEEASVVLISYSAGARRAELADPERSAVMQVPIANPARFPPYDQVLTEASFTTLREDGEDDTKDWQAVGFNSRSLRYCGDIAKILETGLPKDQRPKEGMVIRAFGGQDGAPKAFDFPQAPGIILVMQPIPAGYLPIPAETATLLAPGLTPALKLTVAALRAHATRWKQRALEAEDSSDKQAAMDKAVSFQARVDAVLARAPSMQAQIEGPSIEPEPAKPEVPAGTDRVTVH